MTNLTALTANASPALVDLLYSVDDPAGVPAPRKVTLQSVMDLFEANMTVPTSVSSAYRTSTILASTSTGEGAALIGSEDAGTYYTATTVEGILQELGALLPAGSIVGTSDTQTLTNKTVNLASNTLTGTTAEFNTALSDGSFATLAGTETLTNKTLTSPQVNQLLDTNGNESVVLTATASGVSYLTVASGTTGNDVTLTGSGETNTGISIQASGTGNVSIGPIVVDGDATVGAGQDNYVLTYDHASGTWGPEPTGGGDVSISGTPADNYLAVWTTASAIEGDTNLQWNGTSFQVTGDIVLTERADHGFTPAAGKGILWVSNDATQKLYFTDDAGTDNEVLTSGSGTALADTVAASDDKFVFFDTSDSDNPKYSNDIAGDLNLAKTTGSTYTGTHNFGGADDFEIPNGTSPVVDTDGQIAIDTSVADFSHGLLKYFSGEEMIVVAMPAAQFTTPADQYVVTYDATADEFQLTVKTGSGIAAVVDDTTPQLGGMLDVNGNAIGDGTRTLLGFVEDASATTFVQIENEATGTSGPIIRSAGETNVNLNLEAAGTGVVNIGGVEAATISGTQTLTNKTVNLSSNTLTGTTAQFNTALSDGSFATLAGTETLTNKTVNLSSNTLTGTTAQFNTALSDGSFATLAGTETLTNKTLTTPVIAQINDTNGNEAITFATTTAAVNYAAVTPSATGNAVDIAAAGGDTNIDLSLSAKGTGVVKGALVPMPFAISDETTALTTGTAKLTYVMPRGFEVVEIYACVTTAPTTSSIIIDVNDDGTSIMTTNKLEIDATETSTTTAATAPTLTSTTIAAGSVLTFDIDQIGSGTAGAGAKVTLLGYWT